jgi:cellulose synthase (UDP-forming)
VAFFLTPLWFLLFHLHPLFADLPVLLAYLVPHLLLAPLAASALVPGWPRLLWAGVHESAVAFPLARATLDLVLPRRLRFQVTPKGITSDRRRFDFSSSALTLAAAAVAAVALAKGAFELAAFGIEVEAYAFNLFWAGTNLLALVAALLVSWERPQRRTDERIRTRLAVRVGGVAAETVDLSTSGACVRIAPGTLLAAEPEVELEAPERRTLRARLAWRERVGGEERAGLAFVGAGAEDRRALVRIGFGRAGVHDGAHSARATSQVGMAARLVAGLVRVFLPLRPRRRLSPRQRALGLVALVGPAGRVRALRLDLSEGGMGLLALGAPPPAGSVLPLLLPGGVRWARVAHARRAAPRLWRVGLAFGPAVSGAQPGVYLAAA